MKQERNFPDSQDEMLKLVRDGFYVSGGSTSAHALFLHYLAIKHNTNEAAALHLYNLSYYLLDSNHKAKLAGSVSTSHTKDSRKILDTTLFTKLHPVERDMILKGKAKIEDFYGPQFANQLPYEGSLIDFSFLISKSPVKNLDNLRRVLVYISAQSRESVVYASLKSIAAYTACFEERTWFKNLSENQRNSYKAKGEKICKLALTS